MNPRRAWDFLRSRFGLSLVFVAAVFAGSWFIGRHEHSNTNPATFRVFRTNTVIQ